MKRLIIPLLTILLLTGCSAKNPPLDGTNVEEKSYTQIDQEIAKQMMAREDGHIVVDVRRQDEYDAGHIPGAICVPNESIGNAQPEALPDLDQVLLVYCRSGRRSKEAAQKLFEIGYSNVYEFGGILDWTGAVVAEEVSQATSEKEEEKIEMHMKIGETTVPVTWEKNASVDALSALLPLTIQMSMYGGFEQVGAIGQSIARDDRQTTTQPGDIVLYSGNQIVVFYGTNAWAYTRLGHIDLPQETMAELLGNGDVVLTLTYGD